MSVLRDLPPAVKQGLRSGSLVMIGNEVLKATDPRAVLLKASANGRAVPSDRTRRAASAEEASLISPNPKPRFPKDVSPQLQAVYDAAYAALLLPGKPIKSFNTFKWKHWKHHLNMRHVAADLIDSASWLIPLNGRIPTNNTTDRVNLAFVKFGGRRWDKANFVAGCKEIVDELVARGFLRNDTETWLDDQYYQIPGGVVPRVEIVFHKSTNSQSATPGRSAVA